MESKRQNVIRVADTVSFAPRGVEYDLEPGTIYTAEYEYYAGTVSLKISADFSLPEKIFETEESKKFKQKVLRTFERTNRTTGVMLSGIKGTGKTIMAKQLAIESNRPIILINTNFPMKAMLQLTNKLAERSVCLVIDEIDKFESCYNEASLLQMFDGVCTTGNNLVIATCNNLDNISDCLWDRCSRIRYHKQYSAMGEEAIKELVSKFDWTEKKNDKFYDALTQYIIRRFSVISFDNVNTFCDELNNNPDEKWDELIADMNITEA